MLLSPPGLAASCLISSGSERGGSDTLVELDILVRRRMTREHNVMGLITRRKMCEFTGIYIGYQ
jgi:hypothetical protein